MAVMQQGTAQPIMKKCGAQLTWKRSTPVCEGSLATTLNCGSGWLTASMTITRSCCFTMPMSFATASAVCTWSPVIMPVRMPPLQTANAVHTDAASALEYFVCPAVSAGKLIDIQSVDALNSLVLCDKQARMYKINARHRANCMWRIVVPKQDTLHNPPEASQVNSICTG